MVIPQLFTVIHHSALCSFMNHWVQYFGWMIFFGQLLLVFGFIVEVIFLASLFGFYCSIWNGAVHDTIILPHCVDFLLFFLQHWQMHTYADTHKFLPGYNFGVWICWNIPILLSSGLVLLKLMFAWLLLFYRMACIFSSISYTLMG